VAAESWEAFDQELDAVLDLDLFAHPPLVRLGALFED
jgi:hypothetical protein